MKDTLSLTKKLFARSLPQNFIFIFSDQVQCKKETKQVILFIILLKTVGILVPFRYST